MNTEHQELKKLKLLFFKLLKGFTEPSWVDTLHSSGSKWSLGGCRTVIRLSHNP